MAVRKATVNAAGDIFVHVLEDIKITFQAGAGVASFSGRDLKFEIVGTDISVPLGGSGGAREILVTPAQLANAPLISNFAVVDRTGGTSLVRWAGRLTRYSS